MDAFMPITCPEVIEKFKRYGFEYKKTYSNSSYLTFTFKSGFFHNAEVVQIAVNNDDERNINQKISDLEKLGISIKRNKYETISQIEQGLFDGFFDIENWKNRISEEYEAYVASILDRFPKSGKLKYQYINTPYSLNIDTIPVKSLDNSIVSNITEELTKKGAQLILIEAPAGFGKTCTSYEIIETLAKKKSTVIPFFTEFSRDRQARVFSHVFVKEVDRAFNHVKSNIVIDELQNGRIVMVLDGFDELLGDNSKNASEEDYDNAEPMLETISELLEHNAKIIITSRRAAIFDGSNFNEWIDKYRDRFSFKRYHIHSPRVTDWLDENRISALQAVGIDLDQLSNPVLLGYLRALKEESFLTLIKSPDQIVEHYFTSMLEREMERQSLPMPPAEQTKILTIIAEHMCEENYTSDSKEKIADLFKTKCSKLLENTRRLYPAKDRPTLDGLATTLATHAFFDRSNQGEGRIEFINEFVFGNYIAQSIINFDGDWLASDERFVEPAISSYTARTTKERLEIWNKLESMRAFLSASDRMSFEIKMLGEIRCNEYDETSVNSINLSDLDFFNNACVKNISFSNCTFSNVNFFIDNIENVTFINCNFYSCHETSIDIRKNSVEFLNCFSNNTFLTSIEKCQEKQEEEIVVDELTLQIFRRFFPVGSNGFERIHIPLSSLYKLKLQGLNKRDITKEIKRLKRMSLLTDAQDNAYIAINQQKMAEIKQLLGRA